MARPNKGRSIGREGNLAKRIASERLSRGLSYEGLAKLMTEAGCGIQGSGIFKIEKADPPRKISVDELVALSEVFELPIEDLLTPIDVLEQRRAQELLKEMDEADHGLFDMIGQHLSAYTEFLELAASAPDLYQYVHGHRFAGAETGNDSDALPNVFSRDDLPDYDWSPFTQAVADFFRCLIAEEGELAMAHLATKRSEPNGK